MNSSGRRMRKVRKGNVVSRDIGWKSRNGRRRQRRGVGEEKQTEGGREEALKRNNSRVEWDEIGYSDHISSN
jgi:hypothetical protein